MKQCGAFTTEGRFSWQAKYSQSAVPFTPCLLAISLLIKTFTWEAKESGDSLLIVMALVKKFHRMENMANPRGLECSGRPQCSQLRANGSN